MRLLDGTTLEELSIRRLREFEPEALRMHPNGYWLAFSGGKDSVVILDLAKRAGVKFEAHHNLTTVDPPELVQFVKTFPEVIIDKPEETMWQLIRRKKCPPRRNARYCCEVLKERGGSGRFVITGIRTAESNRRAGRGMVETCYRDGTKRYLNCIKDWPTEAVWEYIRKHNVRYCRLYDEGFRRLGCVLCPMSNNVAVEASRWPRIAAAWERAVKSTFRPDFVGKSGMRFASSEEYWRWYIDRTAKKGDYASQPVLFEDDPALIADLEREAGK